MCLPEFWLAICLSFKGFLIGQIWFWFLQPTKPIDFAITSAHVLVSVAFKNQKCSKQDESDWDMPKGFFYYGIQKDHAC